MIPETDMIAGPLYKVLGNPEVNANLYCHFVYLYWEGCVILQHIFAVTTGSPSSAQAGRLFAEPASRERILVKGTG